MERNPYRGTCITFAVLFLVTFVFALFMVVEYDLSSSKVRTYNYFFTELRQNEIYSFNSAPSIYPWAKLSLIMNYVYYNGFGLCTEKALFFELLAENEGFQVRHVNILYRGNKSNTHAVSQVKIDGEWVTFDPLNNRIIVLSSKDINIIGGINSESEVKLSRAEIIGRVIR